MFYKKIQLAGKWKVKSSLAKIGEVLLGLAVDKFGERKTKHILSHLTRAGATTCTPQNKKKPPALCVIGLGWLGLVMRWPRALTDKCA